MLCKANQRQRERERDTFRPSNKEEKKVEGIDRKKKLSMAPMIGEMGGRGLRYPLMPHPRGIIFIKAPMIS